MDNKPATDSKESTATPVKTLWIIAAIGVAFLFGITLMTPAQLDWFAPRYFLLIFGAIALRLLIVFFF